MHEIAEKGYAAHFRYKQGEQKESGIDVWLNRIQEVLENKEGNAVDFVEDFKLNLYSEEIFVFTPQGELKSLPNGSSVLDFAFSIHTEVGAKARGARINGKLVPLSRTLKSGENVEIITSENSKPTANWLDHVITSRARASIKTALNEEKRRISEDGKELLRRKLKQLKITLNDKTIRRLVLYFKVNTSLDLFYRVGIGTLDNKKLKEFAASYNNTFFNFIKKRMTATARKNIRDRDEFTSKYDKLFFGKDKEELPYSLSKCCNPIAGDKVFGFLTINEGIKVHRNDCPNSLSLQSNFAYRVLPAWWVDSSEQQFSAKLKLSGIDQIGLVNQVTRVISNNMNVDIFKINFDTDDGLFSGGISVRVKNKATLEKLVNNLLKINGIEKVTRD
jgi:GTP pyrophosphokinase